MAKRVIAAVSADVDGEGLRVLHIEAKGDLLPDGRIALRSGTVIVDARQNGVQSSAGPYVTIAEVD
jgi:hypothetical protein